MKCPYSNRSRLITATGCYRLLKGPPVDCSWGDVSLFRPKYIPQNRRRMGACSLKKHSDREVWSRKSDTSNRLCFEGLSDINIYRWGHYPIVHHSVKDCREADRSWTLKVKCYHKVVRTNTASPSWLKMHSLMIISSLKSELSMSYCTYRTAFCIMISNTEGLFTLLCISAVIEVRLLFYSRRTTARSYYIRCFTKPQCLCHSAVTRWHYFLSPSLGSF